MSFTAADPANAAPTLTGETSEPELSTFVLGEAVSLRFEVAGMEPAAEQTLTLRFLDEHDRVLAERALPVHADERGQWRGTLDEAPADRLGFYRVEAALSDGTTIAKLGTRPAGYLSYAVVPDPAKRQDFGEFRSRFGMQGGFGRAWGNRSLALLGARWVLDGNFEWRRHEPDRPGQFAQAVAKNPQKWDAASPTPWHTYALPTLFAAPKWAVIPETFSYMTGSLKPGHEASWQAYCREAVRAFMRKYPDREQRIYQITWEPMPPWGFKGDLEDIVRIYELAYPIIHEEDPTALVGGPTLGLQHGADLRVTTDLFELGLGKYLDAYTVHPYFSMTPERDGMLQRLRAVKPLLRGADGEPLPMIGTEQGQNTGEKRENELKHARALLRQNLITLGEGYRFNLTYYIVDYELANQHGYGYYYNLVDGVPWAPVKAGPKPIVPAYAAQSLLLDGTDAVRAIDWLGETTLGYAFERGPAPAGDGGSRASEVILALWDYGSSAREIALPVGVDRVTVRDWMGRPREVKTDEGQTVTLTLGPEPVYVTGVSPDLWGRAGLRTLSLSGGDDPAGPGRPVRLTPTVEAPVDEKIHGVLVVEADPRLGLTPREVPVTVSAGQRQPVAVDLTLPADLKPGRYRVGLMLREAGRTTALSGRWLHVRPPVTVAGAVPSVDANGRAALTVTLRDALGIGQRGEVTVAIAGLDNGAASAAFALEADETRTIALALPDARPNPLQQYAAIVTTILGGHRYEHTDWVNWYAPPRRSAPPTIDADASDWSSIPGLAVPGLDDPATTVRFAWDDEALYVLAQVRDKTFVQQWKTHDTWRGDSIRLTFNLDPHLEAVESGNELADAGLRARSNHVAVALTDAGPQVYRHSSFDGQALPLGMVPQDRIAAAVRRTEQGLVYELAVRWSAMGGQTPTPGSHVGIDMDIRDLDADDWHTTATHKIFRSAGGAGESSFGLLQIGGDED